MTMPLFEFELERPQPGDTHFIKSDGAFSSDLTWLIRDSIICVLGSKLVNAN